VNYTGVGVSAWPGGRDHVADVVGAALGWVQRDTALKESNEFEFEGGELSLFVTDVGELVREERVDVTAGGVTVVAKFDHASDLGEGESCGLRGADESQLMQSGIVVGAVAVGCPVRWSEEAAPLVVADRLGRDVRRCREVADAHAVETSP
jgi:hypothetical protein